MSSIVIGGGGFVGSAIVKQLIERGEEVAVVGRNYYPEIEKLGVEILQGDILNKDFLTHALKGFHTVYHTAAKAGIWGKYEEYHAINVTGTQNVLNACKNNDVSVLVYTSTPSVVFNQNDIAGEDESLPYADKFLCYYALTKAVAEQEVLESNSSNLKTCALRPHLVWGPGDPHLIPRLLERGKRGLLKQVGKGENMVDISYVDNVAEAHVLAADNLRTVATAAGEAYFISQDEPVNLWSWINELFKRLSVPPVDSKVSFRKAYFAGRVLEGIYSTLGFTNEPRMTRFLAEQLAKSHWFSIEKAKRDLDYTPRISSEDGMNKLVAYIRDFNVV